jgi:hypothetical protein
MVGRLGENLNSLDLRVCIAQAEFALTFCKQRGDWPAAARLAKDWVNLRREQKTRFGVRAPPFGVRAPPDA